MKPRKSRKPKSVIGYADVLFHIQLKKNRLPLVITPKKQAGDDVKVRVEEVVTADENRPKSMRND